MNIDEGQLDDMLAEMRRGFPHGVLRQNNVFSTGLTMSSGRAVGVLVEPTLVLYRVSDGGDVWDDLVLHGYAEPRPTIAERERLERACEIHHVRWDAQKAEIFALASNAREVAECTARVAAASLAIDGWRAWYPPRQTRNLHRKRLVEQISRLAPVRGWTVDRTPILSGRMHQWFADAALARNARRASIEISAERNGEHVMQRIVGFLYDVPQSGLVVVVPRTVEQHIKGSAELRDRVVVVPRLWRGTPRAVVEAAERAAA